MEFFVDWEIQKMNNDQLTKYQEEKHLMSKRTRDWAKYWICCLIGFNKLCNKFGQQRRIKNGNNTNSTVYQYLKNINST